MVRLSHAREASVRRELTALPSAYGVYNLGLSLMNEEILRGNALVGRRLKEMAGSTDDDSRFREYAVTIANQVLGILRDHVFNI